MFVRCHTTSFCMQETSIKAFCLTNCLQMIKSYLFLSNNTHLKDCGIILPLREYCSKRSRLLEGRNILLSVVWLLELFSWFCYLPLSFSKSVPEAKETRFCFSFLLDYSYFFYLNDWSLQNNTMWNNLLTIVPKVLDNTHVLKGLFALWSQTCAEEVSGSLTAFRGSRSSMKCRRFIRSLEFRRVTCIL